MLISVGKSTSSPHTWWVRVQGKGTKEVFGVEKMDFPALHEERALEAVVEFWGEAEEKGFEVEVKV
jgi:hypothetical protein